MAEDSVQDMRRAARVAERERMRIAVHDYDNILAVVSGSVEMALRRLAKGDAQDAERMLRRAQEAVKRGAALSARLVAFSRGCDEASPEDEPAGRQIRMGDV